MRRRHILPTRQTKTQAKKRYFRRNNRKAKYADPVTGLFPYVLLLEADGKVYPEAERFLAGVSAEVERKHEERKQARERAGSRASAARPVTLKSIDTFRSDPRYGGDGNRIDLAYAIYAFSHGLGTAAVSAAIRTRDLAHKGNERRQDEYVERTIKKAMGAIEREVEGRGR